MLSEGKFTYAPRLPYPQRRTQHMVERQNLVKKSKKKVNMSQCMVKPNINVIKDFVSPDLASDNVVQMEK